MAKTVEDQHNDSNHLQHGKGTIHSIQEKKTTSPKEKQLKRREKEIRKLRKEIRILTKQFKNTVEEKKGGIKELTSGNCDQLHRLRGAE